jgi:hypothetical protein
MNISTKNCSKISTSTLRKSTFMKAKGNFVYKEKLFTLAYNELMFSFSLSLKN